MSLSSDEKYTGYGSPLQSSGWSSLIGIITAIVGNILISFALNIQRYAHIRIDHEYKNRKDPRAKSARENLPKSLRNYGTAVEQEEAAEERRRINEQSNGKQHERRRSSDHSENSSEQTLRPKEDRNGEGDDGHEKDEKQSYLKSPYWWAGIVMMTVGEAGNFLAYGFAPASIVSPLGVVGLISNCLIAPFMLKERFRQRDFWGVLVAVAGAVTVVLSAKTSEKKLSPEHLWEEIKTWTFLVYVVVTVVCIVALVIASPRYGHRTILINLGLVGLFGGYTALSTKGVASLFTTRTWHAFEYPILYVLILVLVLSAVLQIRYLNKALQDFDSTQVIPVQFVLFTLSVITGSAVLYRDFERTDAAHVIKFIVGCLLTFGGVYLITSGRKGHDEDDDNGSEQPSSDTETERIYLLDEERGPKQQQSSHEQGYDGNDESNQHDLPAIAVTPAHEPASPHFNARKSSDSSTTSDPMRPRTPPAQIQPHSSSSAALTAETPFFTPSTSRPTNRSIINRTTSTPIPSQTPIQTSATRPAIRNSISRFSNLVPVLGPLIHPLSSSLTGIIADQIIRGEGISPQQRAILRTARSYRGANLNDVENAAATDSIVQSAQTRRRTSEFSTPTSPLLRRSNQNAIRATPADLNSNSNLGASPEVNSRQNVSQLPARWRSMSASLPFGLSGLWGNKADESTTTTTTPPTEESER